MFTLLITGLCLFLIPGLAVLLGDHLFSGIETHSISTRELPNIAAELGVSDIGISDTDRARR